MVPPDRRSESLPFYGVDFPARSMALIISNRNLDSKDELAALS